MLGYTPEARDAPLLPLLVLPFWDLSAPFCPFAVASADGSRTAVGRTLLVTAVVGNVTVADGSELESASLFKNTRAKPGAGTVIWHVPAV